MTSTTVPALVRGSRLGGFYDVLVHEGRTAWRSRSSWAMAILIAAVFGAFKIIPSTWSAPLGSFPAGVAGLYVSLVTVLLAGIALGIDQERALHLPGFEGMIRTRRHRRLAHALAGMFWRTTWIVVVTLIALLATTAHRLSPLETGIVVLIALCFHAPMAMAGVAAGRLGRLLGRGDALGVLLALAVMAFPALALVLNDVAADLALSGWRGVGITLPPVLLLPAIILTVTLALGLLFLEQLANRSRPLAWRLLVMLPVGLFLLVGSFHVAALQLIHGNTPSPPRFDVATPSSVVLPGIVRRELDLSGFYRNELAVSMDVVFPWNDGDRPAYLTFGPWVDVVRISSSARLESLEIGRWPVWSLTSEDATSVTIQATLSVPRMAWRQRAWMHGNSYATLAPLGPWYGDFLEPVPGTVNQWRPARVPSGENALLGSGSEQWHIASTGVPEHVARWRSSLAEFRRDRLALEVYSSPAEAAAAGGMLTAYGGSLSVFGRLLGPASATRFVVPDVIAARTGTPAPFTRSSMVEIESRLWSLDDPRQTARQDLVWMLEEFHRELVREVWAASPAGFETPDLWRTGVAEYLHTIALWRGHRSMSRGQRQDVILMPTPFEGGYTFPVVNVRNVEVGGWMGPMEGRTRDMPRVSAARQRAFVHALRGALGDDAFIAVLRRWREIGTSEPIGRASLVRALTDVTGHAHDAMLAEWLDHGVVPDFEISYVDSVQHVNPEERTVVYRTTATVANTGHGRVEVEVVLFEEGGHQLKRVLMPPDEPVEVAFESTRRPSELAIDPQGWYPRWVRREELTGPRREKSRFPIRVVREAARNAP